MLTTSTSGGFLIRDELWEKILKEELFPYLLGMEHVRWVTGMFPDGDTLTIPTTGRMPVRDYTEGEELTVEDPTTNEIQLIIEEYRQAGFTVTDKMMQDSYIIGQAIARWQADIARILREDLDGKIFNAIHNSSDTNAHTAADGNAIDGVNHRIAADGTSGALIPADLAYATYALRKANVPPPYFGFFDPKAAYDLFGLADFSSSPLRQDVYGNNEFIKTAMGNGAYRGHLFGVDMFETNQLPTVDSETLPDRSGNSTTVTTGVVNQIFGYEALFGAMREDVEVRSFRDDWRKQQVYYACARYGIRVYRPESIIAIVSDV